MIGRVVSAKMNHTVTVLVERTAQHPLYKKTFMRSKKYLVDDPVGAKEGDVVEVVKIKPISKNKHWQVTKVLGQNLAEIVEAQQKEAAEEVISEVMPESPEESDEIRELEDQSVSVSADQQIRKSEKVAEKPKRKTAGKKKETK